MILHQSIKLNKCRIFKGPGLTGRDLFHQLKAEFSGNDLDGFEPEDAGDACRDAKENMGVADHSEMEQPV